MGVIENISINQTGSGSLKLSWIGDSEKYSRIFLNGKLSIGPVLHDGTNKESTINCNSGTTVCVEIHEGNLSDTIESIYDEPDINPIVYWNPVDGAEKYLIYHQGQNEGTSSVIDSIPDDGRNYPYHWRISESLSGTFDEWNKLSVEAVDVYNQSSTTDMFFHRIYNLPGIPNTLSISGTDGTFTISII